MKADSYQCLEQFLGLAVTWTEAQLQELITVWYMVNGNLYLKIEKNLKFKCG